MLIRMQSSKPQNVSCPASLVTYRGGHMQRKDNSSNERNIYRLKLLSNASFKCYFPPRKSDRQFSNGSITENRIFRSNARRARDIWGNLSSRTLRSLKQLSHAYALSVEAGDLQLLDGKWYVTHAGLLSIANRAGCSAITTAIDHSASEPSIARWVFKATVYKARRSKGFVGYGDADRSNVSPLVRGAEMRVAETRAVNRALRKAYGIGLCSAEELDSFSALQEPVTTPPHQNGSHGSNGSSNGRPRLRDQLCLLIRQHNLDPNLVKAYAADFCGTETLKDASRDLVEAFIAQLAAYVKKDRDGLVCKLNSYAQPVEAKT